MKSRYKELDKNRIARWQEAKWAVEDAAYFEYLPDYRPGWLCFSAARSLFPHPLSTEKIKAYRKSGADYMVFYKPGLFPSHLDREHGMRRYRAWVEYFLRGRKLFSSAEEFSMWLEGWEHEVKEMVNVCHYFGIKVVLCCSDAFNIGGHVYNENWFHLPEGFPTTKSPDKWVTDKDDPVGLNDPIYTKLPEGDLIAPSNASADYVEYCRISAEQLIANFGADGLYYDNNAPKNTTLLQATAQVAHKHGGVVMLHHSSDNMTVAQFQTADYWYTGEHSYGSPRDSGPKKKTPCDDEIQQTPHDFLRRRQTMGAGFMYGIALSNCWWGGAPNTSNTAEAVGIGFLMCSLKFPMLYPGDPDPGDAVAKELWNHYLPLYKEMVKPGTVAYVCVTNSSFVQAATGQFSPLTEKPLLFYDIFVNNRIYLLFTNDAKEEACIKLTHSFKNMETNEVLSEATMPPKSVLMLVKL